MTSALVRIPSDRYALAVTTAAALSLALSLWVVTDYYAWKAFGGTPPNLQGYIRVNKLRWKRFWSDDNLLDDTNLPLIKEDQSFLSNIPPRAGGRPRIYTRPLPQRQYPEPIDPSTRQQLMSLMEKLHSRHSDRLRLDLSKNEGLAADAIYALPNRVRPAAEPLLKKLGLEIAHAHPSDNSLHLMLSPSDCRKVIAAQWGQRFVLDFIPQNMIWVYAPRNAAELEIITQICEAAIAWCTV